MTATYVEQQVVHSNDSDYKRECRLSLLLEWMQRVADGHIAKYGVSLDELVKQGMAWMLMTVDLELDRLPSYGETIEIETWNKGSRGVQWQRDYRIYGPNKEHIAKARTVWALVDLNKRKILRPSAFPHEIPVHTDDSVGAMPEKVSIPEDVTMDSVYSMEVRHSSIDMNGHMNNARFADICLDALSREQLDAGLSRFHITFHQEAVLGDEFAVLLGLNETGASSFFRGESAVGKKFFEAMVETR